jgi:hypothetical protein
MDEEPSKLEMDSQQPGSDRSRLYTGRCVGGPLDGQVVESRFPKGFVLVSRAANMAWIYDHTEAQPKPGGEIFSTFQAREPSGRTLDDEGRLRAAMEHEFDVRAQ